MLKANRLQTDNILNEFIDHFTLLNQHEHLNILKQREKT